MSINIFPPIIQSTQPAFLASSPSYNIYYSLQSTASPSSIKHIQIRIISQRSNVSVVNSKFPDGVIYQNVDLVNATSPYKVEIRPKEHLKEESWTPGLCYKIQLRFGTTPYNLEEYNNSFAQWKKKQIDNSTFSEWSTVMLIKAINEPYIYIQNTGEYNTGINSIIAVNTTTPLFTSFYQDNNSNEILKNYKYILYNSTGENIIESSDWIAANGNQYSYRFKYILTNGETYQVRFYIQTKNGYKNFTSLTFLVNKIYLDQLKNTIIYLDNSVYCQENGCNRIFLTTETPLTGNYILTRVSEKSNYQISEDLQVFNFFEYQTKNTFLYTDYTIESGVKYKYSLQYENSQGLRSSPIYTNPHSVDFEFSYLYRDGIQIKLNLNNKISNFKHTTLISKLDTLGNQYPYLFKNGQAYYAEFSISGLISYQSDEDQTFFNFKKDGCYYKDELVIPIDKFSTDLSIRQFDRTISPIINSSISDDNIFIERKFREKVEEFLNDFNYKLFKSPTEGNIIIGLMNISLTPEESLGRMIYNFTATAYEVAECTLDNLNKVGIINREKIDNTQSQSQEIIRTIGQIAGIYKDCPEGNNIQNLIKQQEEKTIENSNYKLVLSQINSFWIEKYPDINFQNEINNLNAKKQLEELSDKELAEIDKEIARQKKLQAACANNPLSASILQVNGQDILIAPNKLYSLDIPITSLSIVDVKYPIIINYTCQLYREINDTVEAIKQIDSSKIWGQIAGIFSDNDKVLKKYKYYYGPNELPYRIYSDSASIYDSLGRILIDNTTYDVYKSLDLLAIIKEDAKKQVEYIYKIQGGFALNEKGQWTDGRVYYNFSELISIEIEADPGTLLLINKTKIKIGPTGRYILTPLDNQIKTLSLESSSFAIVNYKCITSQTIMEGVEN